MYLSLEAVVRETVAMTTPKFFSQLPGTDVGKSNANALPEASLCEEFGRALAYSAIQQPLDGVTQLGNRLIGKQSVPYVELVMPAKEAEAFSWRWHAQHLGHAVGGTVPFLASTFLVRRGILPLAGLRAAEEKQARSLLGTVGTSFATGFVCDAVFTPVAENQNFWSARAKHGLVGGCTLGVLSTANGILAKSFFGSLQASPGKQILTHAIAGVPAGMLSAELRAQVLHGKHASMASMLESAYSFSTIGGAMGTLHYLDARTRTPRVPVELALKVSEDVKQPGDAVSYQRGPLHASERSVTGGAQRFNPFDRSLAYLSLPPLREQSMQELRYLVDRRSNVSEVISAAQPGSENAQFNNWKEFSERCLVTTSRSMRIYKVKGRDLEIAVPEDYAQQLDAVRALRIACDFGGPLPAETRSRRDMHDVEMHERLRAHPLKDRALPEDIAALVGEFPNSKYVRRINLFNEANPEDPWHRKIYKRDFHSAATASKDGVINLYLSRRSDMHGLRDTLLHEWGHILKFRSPAESKAFNHAFKLENDSIDPYGRRDTEEAWAVPTSDHLLIHPGGAFVRFAIESPLRAVFMARALQKSLENVQRAPERSNNHSQYVSRGKYVEDKILPDARRKAEEIARDEANPLKKIAAVRLLTILGTEGQAQTLSDVMTSATQPKVRVLAFRGLVQLRGENVRALANDLAPVTNEGSPLRDRATSHLSRLALEHGPSLIPVELMQLPAFQEVCIKAAELAARQGNAERSLLFAGEILRSLDHGFESPTHSRNVMRSLVRIGKSLSQCEAANDATNSALLESVLRQAKQAAPSTSVYGERLNQLLLELQLKKMRKATERDG